MNVAVFGYYNNLNYGDDYIKYCLTRIVKEENGSVMFFPHNKPPPNTNYLKKFDWIIIGGGGLVFGYHGIWKNMRNWLTRSRCQVGVAGIGINSLSNENLRKNIEFLVDYSSFFYVRDNKSKEMVGKQNIRVGTDLSWVYPISDGLDVTYSNRKVAFNITRKAYSGRSIEPSAWAEKITEYGYNVVPFPLRMTDGHDKGVLETILNQKIGHKFNMEPIRSCKFMVGARFHSLIFSAMFGKPFIAIAYDDKVERLCSEMGMSEFCLDPEDHHALPKFIDELEDRYDLVGKKIDEYRNEMVEKGKDMKGEIVNSITSLSRRKSIFGRLKALIKSNLGV